MASGLIRKRALGAVIPHLRQSFATETLTAAKEASQKSAGSIYLHALADASSKSALLLGLVNNLQRFGSVGYFSPIAAAPYRHTDSRMDRHVELIRASLDLKVSPDVMTGVSQDEALKLLAAGKMDELLEIILNKYIACKGAFDTVVVGGVEMEGHAQTLDAKISAELGSPVLLAVDCSNHPSLDSVMKDVTMGVANLKEERANIFGILLDRIRESDQAALLPSFKMQLAAMGIPFLGCMPADKVLASVRLDEIKAAVGARLISGDAHDLEQEVTRPMLVASGTTQALTKLAGASRALVVTEGERADLLLALMAARSVGGARGVAGVMAAGAIDPAILTLLRAQGGGGHMPVLQSYLSVEELMERLTALEGDILPSSQLKVARAMHLFDRSVDLPMLERLARAPAMRDYMNPKMFLHNLLEKCRAQKQRIVLPEGTDRRVLRAGVECHQRGLADITLLGRPEEIRALAEQIGVDLTGIRLLHPPSSDRLEAYVQAMVEARRSKGLAEAHARDQLSSSTVYGVMMVHQGDADGMVSGAAHTTADTVRPALQLLPSKTPAGKNRLVSSVFFMLLPDKVLVYGDCAVNVNPTSEELAQIAVASADTAAAFGLEPRVAMLSYATLGSNSGPLVEKVAEAVKMVRAQRPGVAAEGPFQYDAAVDPKTAKVKVKEPSAVAGRANVLIFPDLNTGNNSYKAVQQSTGAIAMGPVLQGLRLPVNDLSRGCTVADIVNTVCITSVQAIQARAAERTAAAAAAGKT